MRIFTTNVEQRLVDVVKVLKGDIEPHFSIHFHLSGLQDHYKSDFQLRIATNILNDIFRNDHGYIFQARDGDIFVVYDGDDKKLVEKAIFQLRYLFVDDPLANHTDGSENTDFCTTYDLGVQWRNFYRVCMDRFEQIEERPKQSRANAGRVAARKDVITPEALSDVVHSLEKINLDQAIRKQPICAIKPGKEIRPVYNEVFTNMAHLKKLLGVHFDLASNRWLFEYLTEKLDAKVLKELAKHPDTHLIEPLSLNLHVSTVLSYEFEEFMHKVKKTGRKISVVMEIQAHEIFANMRGFDEALAVAKRYGCRVCVDGLTNDSFKHMRRHLLGVDLMKLLWNADFKGDLETESNKQLKEVIDECGSNRMILCRCDSQYAIEYGHALGITLFQGRYPDRVLDPDAVVIN